MYIVGEIVSDCVKLIESLNKQVQIVTFHIGILNLESTLHWTIIYFLSYDLCSELPVGFNNNMFINSFL